VRGRALDQPAHHAASAAQPHCALVDLSRTRDAVSACWRTRYGLTACRLRVERRRLASANGMRAVRQRCRHQPGYAENPHKRIYAKVGIQWPRRLVQFHSFNSPPDARLRDDVRESLRGRPRVRHHPSGWTTTGPVDSALTGDDHARLALTLVTLLSLAYPLRAESAYPQAPSAVVLRLQSRYARTRTWPRRSPGRRYIINGRGKAGRG